MPEAFTFPLQSPLVLDKPEEADLVDNATCAGAQNPG